MAAPAHAVPFAAALRVWLRIGVLGFGGPAGQIAMMHRMLVEERRWIGEERFLHALNYCMLLPGPEAQQLATYIGWLLHRTAGGLAAGILFVLPGALVMLALSVLYAGFRELPVVEAAFYGIKAAVLAVVIDAVLRIGRRALKNRAMVAIAAAAFAAIFFANVPFPLIVLAAALTGLAIQRFRPELVAAAGHPSPNRSAAAPAAAAAVVDAILDSDAPARIRPSAGRSVRVALTWLAVWLVPVALIAAVAGGGSVFSQIGLFFSQMAVVTFGGAYAVLAYVAQQAVDVYGWLAPGEMLDGLGLAETTPGPLILVTQFVGFLAAFRHPGSLDPMLAGTLGALLTTWVTFAPSFLWIFLGAPYIEALRGNRALTAALSAITAAVVGVVLNLAVWFGLHVVFAQVDEVAAGWFRLFVPVWPTLDPVALLLTVGALVAMLRFKVGMVWTLAAAAVLGGGAFLAMR